MHYVAVDALGWMQRHVEFVGPSCVGKSTLLQAAITDWPAATAMAPLAVPDAVSRARPWKIRGIVHRPPYRRLLQDTAGYVDTFRLPPEEVEAVMQYLEWVVDQDRLLMQKGEASVSEEGLLHNLGRGITARAYAAVTRRRIFKKRAVILVDARTEAILERVDRRAQADGEPMILYRRNSQRELARVIDDMRRQSHVVTALAEECGCPVLTIDRSSETAATSIQRIRTFLCPGADV